jgi:hypothetical protein
VFDFSGVKSLTIPEGNVIRITSGDTVIWEKAEPYTELQYIVMPSGAWFNTGVVPSADKWTYEIEMYAGTWGSNGYYYLAVRETKDYETMYCPFFVQSGFRMYLSGTKTASAGGAKNTWYTLKSEIEDGLQNMYINGTLKTTTNLAITTNYTLPLYLFGANFHGGKYAQTVIGRIRYLRIHKGDELVHDFVAAKRNEDGVCGLYDRVEGKFYTNKGSGTITGV